MKKLLWSAVVILLLGLVFAGAATADEGDTGSGVFNLVFFDPEVAADPDPGEIIAVHLVSGMFEGLLYQEPNFGGKSRATCVCVVRLPGSAGGPVGNPGDAFVITLKDDKTIDGIGTYKLNKGNGALAGIKGRGTWTFNSDPTVLAGTYQGETELDGNGE